MFHETGLQGGEAGDAENMTNLDASFDRLKIPLVFWMIAVVAVVHPRFRHGRVGDLRVAVLVLGREAGLQCPVFELGAESLHVLERREIVEQHETRLFALK